MVSIALMYFGNKKPMQSLLVNRLTWGFVKDLCWYAVLTVCVTGTVVTNIVNIRDKNLYMTYPFMYRITK